MAGDNKGVIGQQGMTDGGSELNRASFLHHQMLGRVSTMKLVKVVKVHSGGGALSEAGQVDVTPLVNQVDGQGNATEHGTVHKLQYQRVQGGKAAIIIDPVVGDIGYAVISDRDTSAVIKKKDRANPGSNRRFDMADGVYVGGLLNGTPDIVIQFQPDSNKITIATKDSNGTLEIKGSITATGNITAGQGGSDQISLQGHKHVNSGGIGDSGAPKPGT